MTATAWIIILIMAGGAPARVIIMHGDMIECSLRSFHEMKVDPRVKGAECVPWTGGQA